MGTTGSTNFPTTANAFDRIFNLNVPNIPVNLLSGLGAYYANGADIIISKFDSTGSTLKASTFLGGTNTDGINNGLNKHNYADEIRGEIDLDKKGNVYIASCTRSNNNPITSFGFQTTKPISATPQIDGIIYKLDHNLKSLIWTNYLGGSNDDATYSIAIANNNDIYVTGGTLSANFPVTSLANKTSYSGDNDGYISHISEDGNTLAHSTYFGSSNYDQSYFIELDSEDHAHIFGQTSAPKGDFIDNANYHDSLGGQFIAKFKAQLDTIIWSTRFGNGDGDPDISPTAFLVDVCNTIYLSGWGSSIQGGSLTTHKLDITNDAYQATTDNHDFYIMAISSDGNSLVYGSYIGAPDNTEHVDGGTSRFDRKGKIYQAVCAGCGGFSSFPTYPKPGAWSNTNNSGPNGCNLAVFKMDFLLPIVIADFDFPNTGCAPFTPSFKNLSLQQSQTTFLWNFGDGTTSTQFEPNHTFTSPGVYNVKLFVTDLASCNLTDSVERKITILNNSITTLPKAIVCNGNPVQIGIPQNNDPNLSISWSPTTAINNTNISNPFVNPIQNTTYSLIINNGICLDTINQFVELDSVSVEISGNSSVCSKNAPFLLTAITKGTASNYQWSTQPDFSTTLPANSGGESIWVTPAGTNATFTYYLKATSNNGCIATDTFELSIQDLKNHISASFSNPGTTCVPAKIDFNNTSNSLPTSSYLWLFDDGSTSTTKDPSHTFLKKGNHTVTLIANDVSICHQSDTFSMVINIRADSNYTVNYTACSQQDTEIGIPADPIKGITYSWIPANGVSNSSIRNPKVNLINDESFLLVVNHVCTDSITNLVSVSQIQAETDSIFITCSDHPTVNLVGNSNNTGAQFVWSSKSNLSDTLNTSLADSTLIAHPVNTYQYYYFNVKNKDGCQEKDSIYVVISDQTLSITADTFICQQDTIQLHATNNFIDNPMDFYWTPSSKIIGSADTSTIIVAPPTTTTYYLSAVNDSGCTFTHSVLVEVSELNNLVVDAHTKEDSVLLGFSTLLTALPNPGFNYQWTPAKSVAQPNEAITQVSPEQTTKYTVLISDPNNSTCSYSNEVTVHVYEINCGEPEIFIPNAFSPNGDNENDEYLVTGDIIEKIDLQIYNRWGEMVFETTKIEKGWDGTYNGKKVDPTVFVYHLSVTCINRAKFTKKGNITVIR